MTSHDRRYIVPHDFDSLEDETVASLPTGNGTASAMIHIGEEWIDIDATQVWFWTPEWQAGERKVEEYIQEGNFQTFETIEDFLRTLEE